MINSKQLDFMSRQGIDTTDPAQLTDINHVSIDTGLSATERMKAYLEQIKNPYCFRCGETVVRLSFAPAGNDLNSHLISFFGGLKKGVTVQPCDWQKREIEKVFSSDYPHGNT